MMSAWLSQEPLPRDERLQVPNEADAEEPGAGSSRRALLNCIIAAF
jgi:hypothetical protein